MIITNLEYVNMISDLNKIAGGLIESPNIPDIPSVDEIGQAVEKLEDEVNSIIDTLFPNL